ncbi:uncharacterized protein CTRU02_205366 [Colletotrichum truncatum]|uniref:Uncharacterized protein n=1 Tax=Colletotrichum truncatum TaxID=5467 RepID=A0ACC3Z3T6_COLTU|nr:uncharacterized protein CTRU02_04421 [Colletotrichum truncatum]KAF6795611.1 hypothetical protein CTRU02_04421 [Colletotrichum truncatum]
MSGYGRQPLTRRLGIARDSRTRPLETVVGNKPRDMPTPASEMTAEQISALPEEDTESEFSEPESRKTAKDKSSLPAKDDHPSLRRQSAQMHNNNSDSEEEHVARRSRADIQPSRYFGTSKQGREQAKAHGASQGSKKRFGGSQTTNAGAPDSKRGSPGFSSPSPPSKRRKAETSQFDDDADLRSIKRRQKSANSFSKREVNRAKQPELVAKKRKEKTAAKRAKKARSETPEKIQPSFKSYDDDPFDQFDDKTSPSKMIQPASPLLSSPLKSTPKTFKALPSLSPDSSLCQTEGEFREPPASLYEVLQVSSNPPTHPRDLVTSSDGGPKKLSDPSAEFLDSEEDKDVGSTPKQPVKARCPICNEMVDKELLTSFSDGARLNIRKQLQFCRLHKRKSAEEIWKTRCFPEIDWDELPTRVSDHYDVLEDIINGGASHYSALLSNTVKEGKNRTLLKAEGSLTPGYYGPRGLRALSEGIISRFSSVLRKRAVEDRLISSRGYSNYVESVLVPELAVLLICEDMKIGPEEARDVLEESKWIGDLLHEDVGDTVDHVTDDELD